MFIRVLPHLASDCDSSNLNILALHFIVAVRASLGIGLTALTIADWRQYNLRLCVVRLLGIENRSQVMVICRVPVLMLSRHERVSSVGTLRIQLVTVNHFTFLL